MDRHHRLEPVHQRTDLVDRLALHGLAHHRCRALRDRATLAADLDVGDHAVGDVEVDLDLVAAQRVVADGVRGRRRQLAAVARAAVVIEDDLAVQVFQAGHRMAFRSEPEDIGGAVERIGQHIDLALVVVQVEAGAGRGGGAQHAHERLGAVVAGADAHVALVQHLAEVVRVDAAEREAERGAAELDVARAVDGDVVAEALGQGVQRVLGDLHLVLTDVWHADALQEVDRCTHADRLDDRRRAGLELGRQLGRREPVEADVGDHVAATQERRHGVEQLLATPQHTDARRPAHLVAAERHEVGVPRLHVGHVVRHVLAAVDDRDRAGGMRGAAQLGDRRDGAQHVAHRREAERLGAIEQRGQIGQVELAVGGQRHPAQLDAALGRQHVPRHDVGVVLHVGQHDDVAAFRLARPHEYTTRFSASVAFLVKMISCGAGRVDEALHLDASALEGLVGLGRQSVRAAIDRRVGVLHERRPSRR